MSNYRNILISPRGLTRHGPIVRLKDQPPRSCDLKLPMIVVGKFIDDRSFSARRVKDWITCRWRTNGVIDVEKVGSVFMLHCSNIRDRDNLVDQETGSLNGTLFVMTPWFPHASVQSFQFKEACLWVRVEGLPLTAATPEFVKPILNEIGKVMYFDQESMEPGIKEFLRIKVRVPLHISLIPGFYFEAIEGEFVWVYLRYEHVYVFCKVCGRIGHKEDGCRVYVSDMQNFLGRRMGLVAKSQDNVRYEDNHTTMFSEKIIGLKRSNIYKNSCINLVNYKRWRPERVIRRKKSCPNSSDSSSSLEDSPVIGEHGRRRRKRKLRTARCVKLEGKFWEKIGEAEGGINNNRNTNVLSGTLISRRGLNTLQPICPQKRSWEVMASEWITQENVETREQEEVDGRKEQGSPMV